MVGGYIYHRLGPKIAFPTMYAVSALGTALLLVFWTNSSLVPIFIVLSRFGIVAAFNMCYIFGVQLIPTIFAASTFGICNAVARITTTSAPVIAEIAYPAPLIVNLGFCAIAFLASLFII